MIFLLIFTFFLEQYLYENQIKLINQNIVEIRNHALKGSGFIINIKNKSYVLTNAHICLSEDYDQNKEKNAKYSFDIKNEYFTELISYIDISKLIFDEKKDLCLIPINKRGLRVEFSKKQELEDLILFKNNNMFFGRIDDYIQDELFETPFKKFFFRTNKTAVSNLNVDYGDSGLPVFTKNLNIHNIVLGERTDNSFLIEVKRSFLITRDDLVNFINNIKN